MRIFGISSQQSEVSLSLEGLIIGNIGLASPCCFRFEVHDSMRRLRSQAKKLGQNKRECIKSFQYLSYRVPTVVRPSKRLIAGQFGLSQIYQRSLLFYSLRKGRVLQSRCHTEFVHSLGANLFQFVTADFISYVRTCVPTYRL